MSPLIVRRAAWMSGAVLCACIAVLAFDWVVAANRAPKDDRLVKHFQKAVKEDAAVAAKLDAEQKRITDARIARRKRDHAVGWVLIASSAVFLTSAKRLMAARGRRFVELDKLKTPPEREKKGRHRSGALPTVAAPNAGDGFVESLVGRHGRGKEAAIGILQAIQAHYRYLPDEVLRSVCQLTDITPAEITGTSTFYGQFRSTPVGRHIIRVCHGTACHVAGAQQITDELRRHLRISDGADTDTDRMFTVEEVACLGCCSLAPVLMVDEHTAGRLTPATARSALNEAEQGEPA